MLNPATILGLFYFLPNLGIIKSILSANNKYYVGITQKYFFPNSVYASRSLLSLANAFSVAARNWGLFNRDRLLFNSGDADLFYF
jgi:hypothetical protein